MLYCDLSILSTRHDKMLTTHMQCAEPSVSPCPDWSNQVTTSRSLLSDRAVVSNRSCLQAHHRARCLCFIRWHAIVAIMRAQASGAAAASCPPGGQLDAQQRQCMPL